VGWGGAFGLAAGELALKSHIASNLPRMLVRAHEDKQDPAEFKNPAAPH